MKVLSAMSGGIRVPGVFGVLLATCLPERIFIMELLKRDYLTITDEGETICMTLDTSHEEVRKVGQKMSEIRPGLRMDGRGWEAFLQYYLDANNPSLLKDLVFDAEGDICRASYKKISAFTRAKGVSLGKYITTLFGEAEEKGLFCVVRDEGDFIDWND